MPTKLHRTSVFALALALSLGAGCGDDKPTKADFVAGADAICKRANDTRASLQERGLKYPAPRTDEELGDLIGELEQAYRGALHDLRALAVPEAGRETVLSMLDSFEAALANFAPFTEAARGGNEEEGTSIYFGWVDALRTPQGAAAKYGLEQCASFGNP